MRQFFLLIFLILITGKAFAFNCLYDFNTKEINIKTEEKTYRKIYIEDNHKITVNIKNVYYFNEIDDYLIKETLDGKYRITYSLNCSNISI